VQWAPSLMVGLLKVTPQEASKMMILLTVVPVPEIPIAFLYLGSWFLLAGAVYYFLGFETGGRSIEEIDRDLAKGLQPS
jgi:hypothetical protein